MNDHLSKPVEPSRLFAVLARWLPAEDAARGGGAALTAPPPEAVLDMQAGLRNVGGRVTTYHQLLRRFDESHGGDGERLRNVLLGGELAQARILAHTLKGVAATLGATRVARVAADIETQLREAQDMETLLGATQQLMDALDATGAAIHGAATGTAGPTVIALDAPQLATALARLDDLLAEDDLKSVQSWRELLPALRARHASPTLTTIDEAMKSFDLPAALAALRTLRAEAYFRVDAAAG